jgi:sugar phosphate isomerase/epimerase
MYKNLNPGALGHNVSFDKTVAFAKHYRFPGVDLDLGYLSNLVREHSLQAAKDWFVATGLRAGAIGVNVKWREADSDADFEASLGQLREDAALAQTLGCTRGYTWMMPGSNKLTFSEHWNLAASRLKKVARVLADHGIAFGLEFVGPATIRSNFKHDFIHTMDAMRGFAAVVGADTDNVGLLLDCFHLYTCQGFNSDIKFLDPKEVVYVHVNDAKADRTAEQQIDNEREMVGATGVIDIKGFFDGLRHIGYDGPVTVEPFNKPIREMTAEAAIKFTSESLDKVLG